MKLFYKILLTTFCSICVVNTVQAQAHTENIVVNVKDINEGYFIKKIPLAEYTVPKINISETVYESILKPNEAQKSFSVKKIDVKLGKELKRPFALLYIPVYKTDENGTVQQLKSLTVNIIENDTREIEKSHFKTTASNSVLATGTWYKIAVKDRGVYKIDYSFINDKLGVNPSTINPANIRIYGNGGTMLSENNAVSRIADLQENAIQMIDGGDGAFNNGDYFLFYANGPTEWTYNPALKLFLHKKNLYEDSSFYFINFDLGGGQRVSNQGAVPTATTTVTSFNDYQVHEEDSVNLGKYGKEWWGEPFGTDAGLVLSKTFNFNLGSLTGDTATVRMYFGSRAAVAGNSFTVQLNTQTMGTYGFRYLNTGDEQSDAIDATLVTYKLPLSNSNASIAMNYSSNGVGRGYLNFIEWNTRRQLSLANGMLSFRDVKSVSENAVANYPLQNANSNTTVWDVTNPLQAVRMNGSLSGSTYSFSQNADALHEFIAFDGSSFLTPVFKEKVANQNLRGNGSQDFLIVTHPNFIDAANKLADFHRQHDGMNVLVATTNQVYNEFSSGSQDISAIRDFAKYFYDNAGNDTSQMPKYLLLFGDASYDYKNRISVKGNYVPTFETSQSILALYGYCSDDFFSFLDDNENSEDPTIANTMDIGLGRLPVSTKDEAMKLVDKIINYASPNSLGPWRLSTTIMADNEDGNIHFDDGEAMTTTINNNSDLYNATKVYLSALQLVSTPGGTRAPDANKMINDQIFKGTFLMNYNGHGSINTLTSERILTQDDFNNWKNINKLPIMVTATCEFSRYDNPEATSSGEKLILKPDGGAIALLTTTQLVYQFLNHAMNVQFLNAQFSQINGKWPTLGEAFRRSKNVTYIVASAHENFRKFALLGDPALTPAFPKHKVVTDSLLDGNTLLPTDSLKALGLYMLKGSVKDVNGNDMNNFNGRVYVSVYEKPKTQSTISGPTRIFRTQNNVIFKGKATVTDGKFSIAFVTPKDLNYDFGKGKISYYVEDGTTDGAATDTNVVVGGFSNRPIVDNNGPKVKPYINDTLFKDGSITGSNTLLHVQLFDEETGINVSGNAIGHDLTAILDGDMSRPYILNDYYEAAPNDYKRGVVNFPINGLADGRHTLRVKAWDMNNNSGEGEVNFVVINGRVMQVENLLNYPNPFTDITHFVFDHNHPDEKLDVTIQIYNTTGALVRTLKQSFTPSGSRSSEITWDGTNEGGAKLPSGLYVYRLNLSTEKGIQASAYEKLILLR